MITETNSTMLCIINAALPLEAISQSDFVALAMTSGGGHASHLCGMNPLSTPYYVDMFLHYLTAVIEHSAELPGQSS